MALLCSQVADDLVFCLSCCSAARAHLLLHTTAMSAVGVEILEVRIYRHEVEPMACAGPEVHRKRCSGVMKDASPNLMQNTDGCHQKQEIVHSK
jgi:hypothetical protein